MATWQCMTHCGACCYLSPEERPDLGDYLTAAELAQYRSLVGTDGWCVHFDRADRTCKIYADRPSFCRVSPEGFRRMFAIASEDFQAFAIDCCYQHIGDIFGPDSSEWQRYALVTGTQ
ncbi:putative Fe-S-cluster oxidoreductase [Rubidibacter lacunae KORDI 51-2]|uniref:Putative Fe-S-cluster oxidoreductase n=1 Tax=Rubidibacter lacunae KORDI 51-2 TaxID=582515 RepID=U5DGT7_9CHRO|nr:YkgJ family cysteine cluster protein [Rubidibacter lacunae]ERN39774.1 putative Fe-S-cluster oxidoreductase [Rubidibacter lacunae KORDI 51-2]